jgi:hypothetical protein
MKIFKNSDGSFDVVNANSILFHAKNGQCKVIGRVSENWRTASKQVYSLPVSIYRFRDLIDKSTL